MAASCVLGKVDEFKTTHTPTYTSSMHPSTSTYIFIYTHLERPCPRHLALPVSVAAAHHRLDDSEVGTASERPFLCVVRCGGRGLCACAPAASFGRTLHIETCITLYIYKQ